MDLADYSSHLEQRYNVPAHRSFLAKTISKDPIGISRMIVGPGRTNVMREEIGFAVHVYMATVHGLEGWVDGRHIRHRAIVPGDVIVLDLESSPSAEFHQSADFLRFQISRRTLRDLAYDLGERPPSGLRTILSDVNDPVLYGLCRALESKASHYAADDQLFTDFVALAFYSHIVRAYAHGAGASELHPSSVLAPWQSRRACELMVANLKGDVTIAEIAEACGLSVSYFTRAFRDTIGVPPHKWLMNERVNRAKDLLRGSTLSISEVAFACGFADQSHLSRIFRNVVGQTPGRWKKARRD